MNDCLENLADDERNSKMSDLAHDNEILKKSLYYIVAISRLRSRKNNGMASKSTLFNLLDIINESADNTVKYIR